MKRITVMTVVLTVLSAVMAFAAGDIAAAAESSPFANFMTNTVQPTIASALFMVITAAVASVRAILKKKYGLEISAATQDQITRVAFNAVHAVEERAAAAATGAGEKWTSESKYQEAINFVLAKVPTLTQAEADDHIHAALAQLKGFGATKEMGS